MPTTAELTEKYLAEHPSIKDCLRQGIINYSKLSRKIAKELNIEKKTSMEAILIAARRYEMKIKKDIVREEKILGILKRSELEIKNKIVAAILQKDFPLEKLIELEKKIKKQDDVVYAIEGTKTYTIITSEKYLRDLEAKFGNKIIKITKNQAMIIMKNPKGIEETTGFTAYLYSRFGEYGVNILETMSCWTDTIFVISEDDIATVMKFLKF
jgi:hypothetical protein